MTFSVSHSSLLRFVRPIVALAVLLLTSSAFAGRQLEEQLSHSVKSVLQRAVADAPAEKTYFDSLEHEKTWLGEMSRRLKKKIPDEESRIDFLRTVHYESMRAGLDAELVLGLIQVESNFRKYAVSSVGARGLMQVMPWWVTQIGDKTHNLFNLRTNLRYGCMILRHYLQMEKGDYFRALGRYNGSLGRPEYPMLVVDAWKNNWTVKTRRADSANYPSTKG